MFSNRCSKNSFQIKAIARAKILLFSFFPGGWGVGWGEGAPPEIPRHHPLPQACNKHCQEKVFISWFNFFFSWNID